MDQNELMPNFLVIGAGKSGTTSLDNYLKQHPQIFMSKKKEPNFFAYENLDSKTFMHDEKRLRYYNGSVCSLEPYLNLFKYAKPGQIKGEVSNAYLKEPGAPRNIKKYIPQVKLIAILRQPVERLYSRYLHLARENELPTKDFRDVLDKSSIWWKRDDLIPEGFYYQNLLRYYEIFPSHHIKVLLYEDFNQCPQKTIEEIFMFLNIDNSLKLDLSAKYNKSGFIKSKVFDRTIGHNSIIKSLTKEYLPNVYNNLKHNPKLQTMVNSIRNKNLIRPKLDPELKRIITNEIYLDDIKELQRLLKKDLSHWMKT